MRNSTLILILILFLGCAREKSTVLDQYSEAKAPVPFAGKLAIKENTYKGCFSTDYSTFYFFRKESNKSEDYRIYFSKYRNGEWSEPQKMEFSDSNSDVYPLVSTVENNKLYFTSYRRIQGDTSKHTNANFWYSQLEDGQWQKPRAVPIPALIRNYDSQPSITSNGTIYFMSDLPDWSQTLVYYMDFTKNGYSMPQLFEHLNEERRSDKTRRYWEICMAPDESYFIIVISEKGEGPGLWLVKRTPSGSWTDPEDLGEITKTDMSGNFPYITPDGQFLIFTKEFSGFYILPTKRFLEP